MLYICVVSAVFKPRYARIGVCHSAYYHTELLLKLGSAVKHIAYTVNRRYLSQSAVVLTVHGNLVSGIDKIFFNLFAR